MTELTSATAGPGASPSTPASQPSSSLRSISVVTGLTAVQLLLQFGLQLVLARQFGTAEEMDAFVAALAPPVVIATILAGSLGYVLVPVVAERRASGSELEAAGVASQIGLYLTVLSLVIAGAVAGMARPLMGLLCPGFAGRQLELAGELLRIVAVLIVANGLIAYLNALFHAYGRFARPALAGVVGTLVTLGYVLAMQQGQGIFAVAWGVVIGAVVTVAMLLPFFVAKSWQSGAWKVAMQAGTLRCLWLLMPLLVGTVLWRVDPLLDRYLGSQLPTGSIAQMGYAWRLISGLMLIGTSGLSIVAFPAIAGHAAAGRKAELNAELAYALRFFLFLMVPVCVGLAWFSTPVVRLLFERGKFSTADTQAVALLVVLYVGAVFGGGLGDVLARTFYSLHDMAVPMVVSIFVFLVAAAVKVLVVGAWEAEGLVAATSGYCLLHAVLLGAILWFRLSGDMLKGTAGTLVRGVASSVVACLAASVVIRLPSVWAVLPAAACGAAVYGLMMWVLRDEFAVKLQRRLMGG